MDTLRLLAAQFLTGSRIVLAAGALFAVNREELFLAATLITLGIVTDGRDGAVARKLGKDRRRTVGAAPAFTRTRSGPWFCFGRGAFFLASASLTPARTWTS